MAKIISRVVALPKELAKLTIRAYQKTLSPDHGPLKRFFPYGVCRFEPTCSHYNYQAIEKYGIIKGSMLGFWRILRCNPWNKGGKDPVK